MERHVAAESDDCAHGSDMSASQSQLPSPTPSTTAEKVVERCERQEEVEVEQNDGLRAQATPPPGTCGPPLAWGSHSTTTTTTTTRRQFFSRLPTSV